MAKIASDQALQDVSTRSKAPAYSSTARALMGRVLMLAELLQGRSPIGSSRVTPTNPQRLLGIDHSGPPWGSAWRHPILVAGGYKGSAGNVVGARTIGSFSTTHSLKLPLRLYVRPHATYERAPYSRGYVLLKAYRTSGSGSVDVDITVHRRGSNARAQVFSVTLASLITTPAWYDPGAWCEVDPGYNDLELEFSSASSVVVVVEGLSINQMVKRRHVAP